MSVVLRQPGSRQYYNLFVYGNWAFKGCSKQKVFPFMSGLFCWQIAYVFGFFALPTVFKPDNSGSLPIFLAELERMAGLY